MVDLKNIILIIIEINIINPQSSLFFISLLILSIFYLTSKYTFRNIVLLNKQKLP